MALGYLLLLFIVMSAISSVGIVLLYVIKNETIKNILFYCLAMWSMGIACLAAISLPTNFLGHRLINCLLGFISIMAIILKIKDPQKPNIAYIIVTASTLLGMYSLFFS
ncbi:hypothetical protein ADU80_09625 [Clostridium botulinum]|uniref:Uncharacterized protein n=1 Tax=Clostridium botulinum TaxID=1491 RepID=A0A9Q1UY09_CLOBO|nr:hypothetical protein [Clostridium botulinum]KEH96422.1 hypothetical protein Y848_14215 [Clostridium botulinum C/D str. Sp77]KOA73300.1 hypothetical protein ADU77_13730 [Clostridium botulinum]KOA74764.1 hypothetical protein ADU78_09985 [Clostridium botulinum]KOA83240.1 hypothetical protein ADU75_11205 [Clostridium botulinum]KOA84461.1 hypothetical protein ADU80_09625 [Clostridium botulinum]